MLNIPDNILVQYEAILKRKIGDVSAHRNFKKWLRYFLDFCGKYPVPDSKSELVRLFIEKLRQKKQNSDQQRQAAHAVSLYFEIKQKINGNTISRNFHAGSDLRSRSAGQAYKARYIPYLQA